MNHVLGEKDLVVEKHRIIKGDLSDLSDKMRKLFLLLQTSDYGFTGITEKSDAVRNNCNKKIVIEKATIEDIMLAHIGRAKI